MRERIATQLNEILEGANEIPPWITYGKNSAMSQGSSKRKLYGELQSNNPSSTCVEITFRYYFRRYVLFHGRQKLTTRGTKGLQEKK